jgi:hypothetical protein
MLRTILVDQSTEDVAAAQPAKDRSAPRVPRHRRHGRQVAKAAVRTVLVVMLHIDPQHASKLAAADDQQLLIVSRRQLIRVLRRYVEHYNQYRPHRSLAHATPVPSERAGPRSTPNFGQLRRRDVLGGLIHEYEYAA